eukprot:TRINITY_DN2338_c1_g1_i2.p1 TRINITY_DN2338_c1_g1~~TRINITY_DN2338_c1_g1_i2.p1  ORF type:complete len:324 (+),score=96.17 TRINITY_DN2338_c1_g1_i2:1369-2340(+)
MAISIGGDLYTWGSGGHGRLGLGNSITFEVPQQVQELDSVNMVTCTSNHMLALTDNHRLFSWGANHNGELGLGHRRRQMRPVEVITPERFSYILAGREYSLALGESGVLWGWGSCSNGVLGNGRKVGDLLEPTKIDSTLLFRGITTHSRHVLAICQGEGKPPQGWTKESSIIDPRIEVEVKQRQAKQEEAAAKAKKNTDIEDAYLAEAAKRVAQAEEKLADTRIAVVKRQEIEEEAKRKELEEKQKKLDEAARRLAIREAEAEAKAKEALQLSEPGVGDEQPSGLSEVSGPKEESGLVRFGGEDEEQREAILEDSSLLQEEEN